MSLKAKSAEIVGVQTVYSTNVEDNANYVSDGDIINKNCLIDADYQGVWHIDLHNTSKIPAVVKAGDKIAQFVMYRTEYPDVVEVPENELFAGVESERGEGGFGSTDNQ